MLALGCDQAGYGLMQEVKKHLDERGLKYVDCGTYSEDSVDYPVYSKKVVKEILEGRCDRGILICGTGIGMSLAANKVHGIRAAAVSEVYSAKLTRQHNDANMVCIGARVIGPETAKMIVEAFLTTPFEGGRHQKRVDMITDIENRESK